MQTGDHLQSEILFNLQESRKVLDDFMSDSEQINRIGAASKLMADALQNGGKIIACGNGGSHCDAMHFAEELSGRYRENRKALAAIAISDASHITCVGNDFGFDSIFSRMVEALGQPGDILLGISTSGNSKNIIKAVEAARSRGMSVILLTGKDGGNLAETSDVEIRVPYFAYADRIQEIHIKVIHILILLIEKQLGLG